MKCAWCALFNLFTLCYPPWDTRGYSVQPSGRLLGTYIYTNVLIYTFSLQPSTSMMAKNIKLIKNVIIKFKIDGVGSIKRLHSKGERGEGLNREVLEGKWIFNMLTLMFGTMSFAHLSIIIQVFW